VQYSSAHISDNLFSYPPDNSNSSDVVYWRGQIKVSKHELV